MGILLGSKSSLRSNRNLILYLILLVSELAFIRAVSDLKPGSQNWVEKAQHIFHLHIPTDNFYGPGAAIMMIPFSFITGMAYMANCVYLAIGGVAYFKLSQRIAHPILRRLAFSALPANFYLIWLIDSSQDTVFEFCLLTWSIYFLVKKRFGWFVATTFLLCETRAGYWVFFLGFSICLFTMDYLKSKKFSWRKLIAVYLLFFTSAFNFINYGSTSPALEGGLTAYFSYTKYHYLALPKMDMDVFLSGPQGAFAVTHGPRIPNGSTPAEVNAIYQRAAIDSALTNKKETLLGWMQKFDSYIFDVQKVPHLPGAFVLNQDEMTIQIVDQRLSWQLVVGNLLYEIYRSLLLGAGLIAVGLLIGSTFFNVGRIKRDSQLLVLAAPFIFGIVPGLLIYTETRFKIVSELLLVPLVCEIWSLAIASRAAKQVKE
jgi:hypothetical protein